MKDLKTQQSLFKCAFAIFLPVGYNERGNNNEDVGDVSIEVAEFDFDPGLATGTIIDLQDIEIFKDNSPYGVRVSNKFTFKASVIDKMYNIRTKSTDNTVTTIFTVTYKLEVADKEIIPEMVSILTSSFPEHFGKLPISSE